VGHAGFNDDLEMTGSLAWEDGVVTFLCAYMDFSRKTNNAEF
jgi:hypothetical protein